jgi:hypothetical protein
MIASSHHTQAKALIADARDSGESLLQHTYPPLDPYSDRNNSTSKGPPPVHRPIPALVVFSRDAYPLNLPKLDHYLVSIPSSPLGQDDNDDSAVMFPPLDQLVETGLSIDDLENNSTIAPVWRNPVSILGSLQNLMIGLLVSPVVKFLLGYSNSFSKGSSALASFYSLQGLVNTVQIFALILSTIGVVFPLGYKPRLISLYMYL